MARPDAPTSFAARWAALANLPPFLAMVWAASPSLTMAMVVLRLSRALLPVAMLWIGKLVIDEVVRLLALAQHPDSLTAWWHSGLADHLIWLISAELIVALASDVLGRLVSYTDSLLQEKLIISLSIRLMDHAADLDLSSFEDAGFQDRLDRARRQTMGRIPLVGQIMQQLQDSITVVSFGAGLIAYNPWLVLLLAVALVPTLIGQMHFNAALYEMNWRRAPERRQRDYLRMIGATAETAKEVKIFGLNRFLRDRYLDLAERFLAENRAISRRQMVVLSLLTGIGTLCYYGAYLWIIGNTLTGQLSLGDLAFLSGSFLRLRGLIESMLGSFSNMASQALYLDDLYRFLEEEPAIASSAKPLDVPIPISQGITFENVGFRYPGSERWAVRGLSFHLRAHETVALVGENGAGKTTIVKLLARLYEPTEGRILLDGHDLRDYDLDQLRAAIGVIFQDFVRYAMTAADNIATGRIEKHDDRLRIEAAARRSLADQVIARLPNGYDQMVGKRFARGVELSGGEWQKLAIARAYMRDAQVLVLDEPTAALDARAEFEVFQRFKELSSTRTALLISHRFSSVRMANRIIVLENGKVEASGTHEELIAANGRYRELFELQAQGYR
ncbi:ABC transporter ATP-binding protein [Paracoccus seriniphilus]|uniref:ATP-binding cassette, subfamily B n=1 Tax=Paracoccus seriniphilus TaxID=184748 RepID=A0A239PNA8_9RHOB|nr:ABC transporter ATP-binding protein [Paracoccus seriniphilus]WCR14953.1 ABC transporter ATP-binding protein [Paracoccus seriniphilus]SNT71618.1 ATP-binding cassette, subfamily B [Paracoccus seriniphilus]